MTGIDDSLRKKSEHDIKDIRDNNNKWNWRRAIRFVVKILDRFFLTLISIIVIICLYLKWIVVFNSATSIGSFSLFQLSGKLSADQAGNEFGAIAFLLMVVLIAATLFWAFFICRIVIYSTERLRFLTNLAGVTTVLLVTVISLMVSVLNIWDFETLDLPPEGAWLGLSMAPFVAAVCSITIILLVALRHKNHEKWKKEGALVEGSLQEDDIEVIINPEADYRLMYHKNHSVGFVADMGDVVTKNVSSDVAESITRSISEEMKICTVCGEFMRHRGTTCTNCGSRIPGE
jgi:magnesium-transporting ATPase (P-type)